MAAITEDYVSFEVAKLLKEKGFDACPLFRYDDCGQLWIQGGYNKTIKWHFPAPTLQMVIKWLVQKYGLYINVVPSVEGYYWTEKWHSYVEELNKRYPFGRFISTLNSPEEAYEAAIKYCLENLI